MAKVVTPAADDVPGFYIRHVSLDLYDGRSVEQGELIPLAGRANDEKLIRLGYIAPRGDAEPVTCGECGKQFVADHWRTMHGNRAHVDRSHLSDEEREAAADKAFKRGERAAPLHLDNTTGDRATV